MVDSRPTETSAAGDSGVHVVQTPCTNKLVAARSAGEASAMAFGCEASMSMRARYDVRRVGGQRTGSIGATGATGGGIAPFDPPSARSAASQRSARTSG